MMARVAGLPLTGSFIRHRFGPMLVLLLIGVVLAGAVTGLAAVRDSAERAIDDSLRADLAQKQFALQASDPDVLEILEGLPEVAPVRDDPGDVVVSDKSAPVSIRTTTDPRLRVGLVASGAWPQVAGDVALASATADALGVELGDPVDVLVDGEISAGRVVGLLVDPADASNQTMVRLVEPSPEVAATRWLSDTEFYEVAALKPFLDRQVATYQSLERLQEAAAENRPQFLSAMRFVPVGAALLLGLVLVAFVVVMCRRWSRDVEAMVAAGMPRAQAWRRIVTIVLLIVLAGQILGTVMVLSVLSIAKVPVSGWLGQRWVGLDIPFLEMGALLVATLLLAIVALPVIGILPAVASWSADRGKRRWAWATPLALTIGCLGGAVWLFALYRTGQPGDDAAANLLLPSALVFAGSLPFILGPALGVGLPPASRALLRNLGSGLAPVAASAVVVALFSGIWSAQTTYEANAGELSSSPLMPPGSFVLSRVPTESVSTIDDYYRSLGGEEVVTYQLMDEQKTDLRVTTRKLLGCLSAQGGRGLDAVPENCWPSDTETAAPVNIVAIGDPGSQPRADPGLVQEGIVGLILFAGEDGTVERLADTKATPDPALGGNLPGLVVPPTSNVLAEFDIGNANQSMVMLQDFARLSPSDQVQLRSALLRLAPGAETADGTDPTGYDRLRSVANTFGFLGAAGAVVVVLLGGTAMVIAHTLTRRTLIDLGSQPFSRWSIAARWCGLLALPVALTIPLVLLTASYGGQSSVASYGLTWLLPGTLALLASLAIGISFLTVPAAGAE